SLINENAQLTLSNVQNEKRNYSFPDFNNSRLVVNLENHKT
ncbi:MAG: hypothetical protein ACI84C_002901, partial [Flavobacteriales bacterium]